MLRKVVDSRTLSHTGGDYEVRLRLLKKKVLTVVLDTEHSVHYESRDATRWWRPVAQHGALSKLSIQGKRSEKALPPDTGHGYLWRLNSYWTFQELDGGVYVECEAISLTRNIPSGLAWVLEPIIRVLATESLANTLRATRAAVRGKGEIDHIGLASSVLRGRQSCLPPAFSRRSARRRKARWRGKSLPETRPQARLPVRRRAGR